MVVLAALLFSGAGLQLISPQIVRTYIDAAREGVSTGALVAAALAFLGVAVLGQLVVLAETYVASNVGWRATNALRADLAAHCLSLDLSFHNARTPGELIERVDGDVSTLANFFSRFVVIVVGSVVLLAGILILAAREDWRIGAVYLGVTVAKVAFMVWSRPIGSRYALAQRQASAEVFGFLEERLTALPDIHGTGAQAYVVYRCQVLLRALYQRVRKAVVVGELLFSVRMTIDSVGWVATLALVAALYWRGELTLGAVYLLVEYRRMLNRPTSEIMRQLRDLQLAAASLERVGELRGTTSRLPDTGRATLPAGPLSVQFDRVTFRYGDAAAPPTEPADRDAATSGAEALRDVSFSLAAGRVLGLLGRTGSGKSTLARLLFRFYDTSEGIVRVGGVDVRDLALDALRSRIGLVTQEVQLFRATVHENLTLFDPTISRLRVEAALDTLGLGEWVASLPGGLDATLGAGGGLSAGQAQLLAFARVFLRDPGLVVLDEASSRLDPATDRLTNRAVGQLLAGRSGIVIAHRLETVQRVNEVLILEDGAVTERGPRAQLAADATSRFAALLRAGSLDAPAAEATDQGARRAEVVA